MKVWYDSDCGLCSSFISMIRKKTNSSISFIPNHKDAVLPDSMSRDKFFRLSSSTILVQTEKGKLLMRHKAIAELFKFTRYPYRLFFYLFSFPLLSPLWFVGYIVIAKFRSQLSRLLGVSKCNL